MFQFAFTVCVFLYPNPQPIDCGNMAAQRQRWETTRERCDEAMATATENVAEQISAYYLRRGAMPAVVFTNKHCLEIT